MASARFEQAVKVTPEVAGLIFGGDYRPKTDTFVRDGATLLNKNGQPRTFKRFGSITRTIQSFLDDEQAGDVERERLQALVTAASAARRPQ